jgi:hypothetical protein
MLHILNCFSGILVSRHLLSFSHKIVNEDVPFQEIGGRHDLCVKVNITHSKDKERKDRGHHGWFLIRSIEV